MDAVWVGKGQNAILLLETGEEVEIAEKSFVILKRPFKDTSSYADLIEVVSGKIKLKTETAWSTGDQNDFVEIPEKNKVLEEPNRKIFPEQDSLVVMNPRRNFRLKFFWETKLSGYLGVRSETNGRVWFFDLKDADSQGVDLPKENHDYIWHILSKDKKILKGPYTFRMEVLDKGRAKNYVEKQTNRVIKIYW